jgi:hypothetical protein
LLDRPVADQVAGDVAGAGRADVIDPHGQGEPATLGGQERLAMRGRLPGLVVAAAEVAFDQVDLIDEVRALPRPLRIYLSSGRLSRSQ